MSSEPQDRPAPAPPPPGGEPRERAGEPLPSEPERWPTEEEEVPAAESWEREAEGGEPGWQESDSPDEELRLSWPLDDQQGPGLELLDDPSEREEVETGDDWEREEPLQTDEEQP